MNNDSKYYLKEKSSAKIPLIAGIVMLVLSALGYITNSKYFFHSYLLAYTFWLSVALGALFFTMVNHLVSAHWWQVLRRIVESLMYSFPILAILFIPILFGMHDLFHWTHTEDVLNDPILLGKEPYLNSTFFIIRAIFYFAVWFILSRILYKYSIKQDESPSEELIEKMKKISAPGLVLFAVTLTFASIDWLMSLDPHWYSTIFGVYYFAGSFVALLSFTIIVAAFLHKKGILKDVITIEHFHDLGKFLFGFTVFWGYIGASQYFLIWYANIPEETVWYYHRWEGSWKYITLTIVFGHFLLPFLLLIFRYTKRNLSLLSFSASWIFLMHIIDLYWLVYPMMSPHHLHFYWTDITVILGIGGIFVWNFWNNFSRNALVPVNDRRLDFSLKFKNF